MVRSFLTAIRKEKWTVASTALAACIGVIAWRGIPELIVLSLSPLADRPSGNGHGCVHSLSVSRITRRRAGYSFRSLWIFRSRRNIAVLTHCLACRSLILLLPGLLLAEGTPFRSVAATLGVCVNGRPAVWHYWLGVAVDSRRDCIPGWDTGWPAPEKCWVPLNVWFPCERRLLLLDWRSLRTRSTLVIPHHWIWRTGRPGTGRECGGPVA